VTASLRIAVDASGPSVVVTVGGDLDYPTADTLRDTLGEVLAAHPASVTIDVGALSFIDSTGLAVLVHAWRNGAATGVPLRLRHEPPFLLTILEFTGVGELLARPAHRPVSGSGAATG
jgi:anti-anti-sigma factor